ncbi:MAG: hypothetical protein MHPSP_003251, partial [Paramarteilia canceri]
GNETSLMSRKIPKVIKDHHKILQNDRQMKQLSLQSLGMLNHRVFWSMIAILNY